ncbi:hypothetical protein KR084_006603 [Drosophila pseudotakahashii]|nr:hypothetical protein KR084_006603 [Drosophila pseudotakahashii]
MSSRWIICIVVVSVTIVLSTGVESGKQSSEILLEESNHQLNMILESINEIERQRIQDNTKTQNLDRVKQRPNSKRLRWNRRRRIISDPEEPEMSENRAMVAPSSITIVPTNPDYLNVKNYLPTPAPWWYN